MTLYAIDWEKPAFWSLPPLLDVGRQSSTSAVHTIFNQAHEWTRFADCQNSTQSVLGVTGLASMSAVVSAFGSDIDAAAATLKRTTELARDSIGVSALQGYTDDAPARVADVLREVGFSPTVDIPAGIFGQPLIIWEVSWGPM